MPTTSQPESSTSTDHRRSSRTSSDCTARGSSTSRRASVRGTSSGSWTTGASVLCISVSTTIASITTSSYCQLNNNSENNNGLQTYQQCVSVKAMTRVLRVWSYKTSQISIVYFQNLAVPTLFRNKQSVKILRIKKKSFHEFKAWLIFPTESILAAAHCWQRHRWGGGGGLRRRDWVQSFIWRLTTLMECVVLTWGTSSGDSLRIQTLLKQPEWASIYNFLIFIFWMLRCWS